MIGIPFIGSKRNYYKHIKEIVIKNGYTETYEPFGGSGILTVNLKNDGLINRGVINDYDKYFLNFESKIKRREEVINKCIELGIEKRKDKKLNTKEKEIVRSIVKDEDHDFLQFISNNFCFSAVRTRGVEVKDFSYFMGDIKSDKYFKYMNILNTLEVTNLDYKDFIKSIEFSDKGLLLVDPPYVMASDGAYKNKEDFCSYRTYRLIKALKDLDKSFIIFNNSLDVLEEMITDLGLKIEDKIKVSSSTGAGKSQMRTEVAYHVKPI